MRFLADLKQQGYLINMARHLLFPNFRLLCKLDLGRLDCILHETSPWQCLGYFVGHGIGFRNRRWSKMKYRMRLRVFGQQLGLDWESRLEVVEEALVVE